MNWKWHLAVGFMFQLAALVILYQHKLLSHFYIIPVIFVIAPLLPDIDYIQGKISQIILFIGTAVGIIGILSYFILKMSVLLLLAGFIIMAAVFIIATVFKHRGFTHSIVFCLLCAAFMYKFFGLSAAVQTFAGVYSHLIGDVLPLKVL